MESKIKGLAKGLIEEVIKADMTMQANQVEAWTWMAKHIPRGKHIPKDIFKGFPESRYLAMNEVTLHMYLKPVRMKSYWKRAKEGIKLIFGGSRYRVSEPYVFDFCDAQDKNAQSIQIIVKRLEDGNIKADYRPSDANTSKMMFA